MVSIRSSEHILRNASGGCAHAISRTFEERLSPNDQVTLLNLIYYPRETFARLAHSLTSAERTALLQDTISRECELIRLLASRYTLRHARRLFPAPHEELFAELIFSAAHPCNHTSERASQRAIHRRRRR
ncbi:MAG: fructose-bisphosphatase class III [Polyangiaceae bacterium]